MNTLVEKQYSNERAVKDMIYKGHRRGVCDSDGRSVKVLDGIDCKVTVAKPKLCSSCAKTYVYRNGKMVLKE